jgi:hypothetical protein
MPMNEAIESFRAESRLATSLRRLMNDRVLSFWYNPNIASTQEASRDR